MGEAGLIGLLVPTKASCVGEGPPFAHTTEHQGSFAWVVAHATVLAYKRTRPRNRCCAYYKGMAKRVSNMPQRADDDIFQLVRRVVQ